MHPLSPMSANLPLPMTLAEAVMPMSIMKPLFFAAALIGWARVVTYMDKDADYFHLYRHWWGLAHLVAGMLAVLLLLLIPIFWLGIPVAMLLAASSAGAYVFYRNTQVQPEQKWDLTLKFLRQRYDDYQRGQATRKATMVFVNPDGVAFPPPATDDAYAPAHDALTELVETGIERHAELIDMTVTSEKTSTLLQIDGVRFGYTDLEPALAVGVIDYVKFRANLDVQDRRKQQAGRALISTEKDQARHTLDVQTSGSTKGLSMRLLLDPTKRRQLKLDELGLLPTQLAAVKELIAQPGGVVIVTGPAQQGVTTTLYSLLSGHDPYTQSIVTLEENVEAELEGISHTQLDPAADGKAKAQKLASLCRRDPDVVMIGHVADPHTPKVIVEACGHTRVYFGLSQADVMTAVKGWSRAVGEARTAADTLRGVLGQRLVRKLCTTCRVPYQPDPAQLRKLNLSPDRVGQLYKHSGKVMDRNNQPITCPACGGVGYRGRLAVFEVIVLDDEARALMAEGKLDAMRQAVRKRKLPRLDEAALSRVVDGTTSISEVTRAMKEGATP